MTVGPGLSAADLLNVDTEGTALVSSSSGLEDAHEADAVRGSFFTHYFTAGLRGAADREGDGAITLQEAFEYARDRTIRDSARLAGAPQHPSFDLELRGRHDIVLATMPTAASALQLTAQRATMEIVHLPSGVAVADVIAGERVRIVVPPGRYLVRSVIDGRPHAKEIVVDAGETASVGDGDLAAIGTEPLAIKGDENSPLERAALDFRPTAYVHVDAAGTVVLEQRDRNGPWIPACVAPCDRALPLTSNYRLVGASLRSSEPFQLAGRGGDRVVVRANTVSNARFGVSLGIVGLGAVSFLSGGLIHFTNAVADAGGKPRGSGPSNVVANVMMGAGVAAIAGGVALLSQSLHTKAEQMALPTPTRSDAGLRAPQWCERARPTPSVAIVDMTF